MEVTNIESPPTQAAPGPTPFALEHRVYHTFEDLAAGKQEWDALAERTGDILCTFDWCDIWWKHFGGGRRLEIHTLRQGDTLLAVLPLFRETIAPGGAYLRTVRVVGCDYTIGTVGLAVEPDHAGTFIRMVIDDLCRRGGWDILQIAPLRSYGSTIEAVAAAASHHPKVQTTIIGREDNWCTLFYLPASYNEFLAALPGKTRNEVNRRERQLAERHHVELQEVADPQQIQAAMDHLVSLHQKRWIGKGQPGQFGTVGPVEQFHRDIAQRAFSTGRLVLLLLKGDGQVISVTYGYRFAGRLHALFGSHCYEPQWQRFGIGRVMYSHLIRYAVSQNIAVIEDGRGVFEHKLSLGGRLEGERSLVVVRAGWTTRLRFWAALRMAYAVHVLYSRIWVDIVAPRLGIHPKGRHFHVRYGVLAQLHRRVRFRLLDNKAMLETSSLEPVSDSHRA